MSYNYGAPLNSVNDLKGRDSVDILARVIYDEAENQSWAGKQGVAAIVANRKKCTIGEFADKNTVEAVVLHKNQFAGIVNSSSRLLKPNTSSQGWNDSLYIAMNSATQDNPIGKCLWFRSKTLYNSQVTYQNGVEYFNLGGGAKKVIEKYTIGDHTFFNLDGYGSY